MKMTPLEMSQFFADSRSAMPEPPFVASLGPPAAPKAGVANPPVAAPAVCERGIKSGRTFHSLVMTVSMFTFCGTIETAYGSTLNFRFARPVTYFSASTKGMFERATVIRASAGFPSDTAAAAAAGAGAASKPGMAETGGAPAASGTVTLVPPSSLSTILTPVLGSSMGSSSTLLRFR